MSYFKFTSLLLSALFLSLCLTSVHAATCTWTACNGDWSNPANWDCGMVPGASDDVIINNGCGPTLDVNATVASLEVSNSSTLGGTANLTVNGDLSLDDAVINTSGNVTINNGTFEVTASSSINNLFLNSATVNQDAPLSLGGTQMDANTTWESNAILTIVDQFSNLGIFNLNIPGITTGMSGSANFNNQGTFNQTNPTASLTLTPILSMFGTWNIEGTLFAGNLAFVGGVINIANSGDLLLNNATLNNGTTFNFTGNGQLTKTGSATLNINHAMQLNGVFEFNEGDIGGSGSLTVANGGTFNYQAAAVGFNIGLTVDAGGTLNTSGSFFPHEFSGLLTNNGTVNQNHSLDFLTDGIVNNGNWNWQGGMLNLNNSTYFDNFGTLTVTHDGTVGGSCSSVFNNESGASVVKSAGGGDLTFDVDFDNDGQLSINTGNVRLNCPYSLQGNIIGASGTIIKVSSGTVLGGNMSTVIANGVTLQKFGSGSLVVDNPLIIDGSLELLEGTLGGSSDITVNGDMSWEGGTLNSTTTIASGAELSLNGPNDKSLEATLNMNGTTTHANGSLEVTSGNSINNNGDYTWQNGDIEVSLNATFYNNGNFRIQTTTAFFGSMLRDGLFENAGLFENDVSTPMMFLLFEPTFNNTGTLQQTQPFHTIPFFGPFNNQAGGIIGGLGLLDFVGGLVNNGSCNPGLSPGTLELSTYDNTNATLNIEVKDASGPGSGHDLLQVDGVATLGGTLNVSQLPGMIPAGTSFTILSASGGVTGTFGTVNFPAPATDWTITYQSNDVIIEYQAQPLPVELLDFTVAPLQDHILLRWRTATEINNRGFDIQSSSDGKHWQSIGFVEGQGSSTALHDYHYEDAAPLPGLNYYRLRQVDYDGAEAYSEVRAVAWVSDKDVLVYPNPLLNDKLNINLEGQIETLRLLNSQGQLITEKAVNPYIDSNYEWALPNLPAGVYWLMVNAEGQSWAEKIVKR